MYKSKVKQYFFEAVRELREMDPLLRDSLLRCEKYHTRTTQMENIERFLNNLSREFEAAQKVRVFKKGKPPFSNKVLKDTVKDMVIVFCKNLETHAKRMHESDISKSKREKEIQDRKEFDAVLAGHAIGEFGEAGVYTDESRERSRNTSPVDTFSIPGRDKT